MQTHQIGGGVNNTNGSTSYANNFVYTDGCPMPTGNLSASGTRPIFINGIGIDYAQGASGIQGQMIYQGVLFAGATSFANSGGTSQLRCAYSGGTLSFGRNTANGLSTYDAADGFGWQGGLCGFIYWATVPTPVRNIAASMLSPTSIRLTFANVLSDGGMGLSGFTVYRSINGGAWTQPFSTTVGEHNITGLVPGNRYAFLVTANNAVGPSDNAVSNTVTLPAPAGWRFNGTTFVRTTAQRRRTATGWVDISQARRFNGTSWVNLT